MGRGIKSKNCIVRNLFEIIIYINGVKSSVAFLVIDLAKFWTGLRVYNQIEKDTIAIEIIVNLSKGMSSISHENNATSKSSNALANTLNIEFNDFKNKLVQIPINALFNIMNITLGWSTWLSESYENVLPKLFELILK